MPHHRLSCRSDFIELRARYNPCGRILQRYTKSKCQLHQEIIWKTQLRLFWELSSAYATHQVVDGLNVIRQAAAPKRVSTPNWIRANAEVSNVSPNTTILHARDGPTTAHHSLTLVVYRRRAALLLPQALRKSGLLPPFEGISCRRRRRHRSNRVFAGMETRIERSPGTPPHPLDASGVCS